MSPFLFPSLTSSLLLPNPVPFPFSLPFPFHPNNLLHRIGLLQHPAAIFFHLLFKCLAIFIYMFGSWFTSNFIFTFVLCIVLLAFDFWTVKNISGRLLVGLRWWSYVREDGSNEWIFESLEDMAEITGT